MMVDRSFSQSAIGASIDNETIEGMPILASQPTVNLNYGPNSSSHFHALQGVQKDERISFGSLEEDVDKLMEDANSSSIG